MKLFFIDLRSKELSLLLGMWSSIIQCLLPRYSPEEFERRIDSELAALDALPFEENKLQRYSVISEDLLEFSDNLIDCDSTESNEPSVNNVSIDSAEESLICFPPSNLGDGESSNNQNSNSPSILQASTPPATIVPSEPLTSPADRLIEIAWKPEIQPSMGVNRCGSASRSLKSSPKMQDSSLLVFSDPVSSSGDLISGDSTNPINPHRKISQERSTASSSSSSSVTLCSDLSRQSDHVSCEDLLEFACDGPNVRRTRGPRNGEQSDEVRIMLKVLHEQSTPESCVEALNVTDWDVLAAIKLERLQGLLRKENNFVGLEDCKVMLGQCGGDVVKAAALLRNTEDTAAV